MKSVRRGGKIMIVALALLVPLTLFAASNSIFINLTIRNAANLVFDVDVDPEEVAKALEDISSSAISFITVSFQGDAESPPVVCLAEDTVKAFNENNVAVTVQTFCRPLGDSNNNRYILGGYIPSDGETHKGRFEASATMEALFQ